MSKHQSVEDLFQIGTRLAELVVWRLKQTSFSTEIEKAGYPACIMFYFCKSYKSFQAIRILWQKGYEEDAVVLSRTVFESSLLSAYVRGAPTERAAAFWKYEAVSKHRIYEDMKRISPGDWCKDFEGSDAYAAMKECYEECAADYGKNPKSWYGMTLFDVAKMLGPGAEHFYRTFYRISSELTHSGSASSGMLLSWDESMLAGNCYPRSSGETVIVRMLTGWLLLQIKILIDAMDLDLQDAYVTSQRQLQEWDFLEEEASA